MASFSYVAYDREGARRRGTIEADSRVLALQALRERGYVVLSLEEEARRARRIRPLSLQQRFLLARGLWSYLRAGLPLVEALGLLAGQAPDERYRSALLSLRDEIKEGRSLAGAMAALGCFGDVFVGMVQAGEEGGMLLEVLQRASELFRAELTFSRKVGSALVYPMVMLVVGISILSFLLVYVVPRIASVFADMGVSLPWTTGLLVGASSFVSSAWPYLLGVLLLLWLLSRRRGRGGVGLLFRLPYVRGVARRLGLSVVASALSNMLGSGIPAVQAMAIAKSLTPVVSPSDWDRVISLVKEGRSISRAMEEVGSFPPDFVYMVAVGEKGGSLPSSLATLAEIYWEEAEEDLSRFSSAVEPIMVVLLGGAVGFVILSVVLPIFEVSQLIR